MMDFATFARYITGWCNRDGVPVLVNRMALRFDPPPPAPDLPPIPCYRIAQGAARLLAETARDLYQELERGAGSRIDGYKLRQRAGHCMRAAETFQRIASEGRVRARSAA